VPSRPAVGPRTLRRPSRRRFRRTSRPQATLHSPASRSRPRNTSKALTEAQAAQREASALTTAANRTLEEATSAIRGAPGAAEQGNENERIAATRKRLSEHLDLVAADLAELGAQVGYAKWLADARNPNRVSHTLPSGRGDAPPSVHVGGVSTDPALVVEHLKVQLTTDER